MRNPVVLVAALAVISFLLFLQMRVIRGERQPSITVSGIFSGSKASQIAVACFYVVGIVAVFASLATSF